jgi:hypothetical protein
MATADDADDVVPFRRALAHLRRWLWRRQVSVAPKQEPEQNGSRSADARARFWTEFREGQREAAAHSARLRQ